MHDKPRTLRSLDEQVRLRRLTQYAQYAQAVLLSASEAGDDDIAAAALALQQQISARFAHEIAPHASAERPA